MDSRFLLIQLRQSGDVIMTTPAIRALRQRYPHAHFTFLTESPSDQVYRNNPHLNEVVLWRNKVSMVEKIRAVMALRRKKFDVSIDFFSNPQSAMISRITAAPRRIGFSFRGRRWAYTDTISTHQPLSYSAAHKMALLGPLGIQTDSLLPEVFPSETDRKVARKQLAELGVVEEDFLVMISPVSRRPYRVWPPENYARLADVLIERYQAKILFQWGPGEEHFIDAVRVEMIHQALPGYPIPTLMEMGAMLERVNLFVGNNNGPRHFAVALNRPTVGVFGKSSPASWTPPNSSTHLTVERDPGCKQSCTYPSCKVECIRDVPYKEVERKVENYIEALLKNGTTNQNR